ncbi:hypothetical protein FHR72_002266 [Mycolicibacterium iranicum]|uniref:Uncharacterized protein n=1 Tax=Mycolicibacterium iranicum TaxID=912594 RepID=A0A839Q5N4_MYCIR|nr:hypothetical protein [Mycolicibacterium iranicum]MBB2990793.1 hypothetical protein [Mycolicibacterium iranicum]
MSLGVGLAVANSSAVAYADTDSEASVSDSRADEQNAPDSTTPPPSGSDEDSPAAESDEPTADDTVADDDELDPGSEPDDSDDDTTETSPDDADVPSEDISDKEPQQPPGPEDDPAEPVVTQPRTDEDGPAEDQLIDDLSESTDHTVTGNGEDDENGEAEHAPGVANVDIGSSSTPAPEVSVGDAGAAKTVSFVSALVSSVVSPFADPEAPAPVPWFDALLAWVRRQITHTFANKTPVYGPITIEQILTGQLFIDLNATDPNGDPLTYDIIQPTHGLVVRDPITGRFVYTPTAIVAGDPLTDSFQIVIRDDSEHLTGALGSIQKLFHGIARLFGLAEKDNVTVTVPVTVTPVVQLPPGVVTVGLPIFTLGGAPVKILTSATITDLDSDRISKAVIKIATSSQDGDVLQYTPPQGSPITVTWDALSKTLTLSGLATPDEYEQALLAISFTATKGGLPRGLTISVTDDDGVQSLVPGAAIVSVIGLPPAIVTIGAPLFKLGGSPVKVVSSVTITDVDSEKLSSATLTIGALSFKAGDVLAYSMIDGNPIQGVWDAATRTLTLSGLASVEQYEQAIKAVTFSTTEGGLSRGVSISVTDDAQVQSLVPGAAIVSVIGLPPAIVTIGAPLFKLGGSPVKVVSSVTITDVDSEKLSSATLTIGALGFKAGDVLAYSMIDGNPIQGVWDAATRTLTLSGLASVEQYEQAIKAVTFSTTEGGLSRGVSISVTDDAQVQALVPGAAIVSVIGLPPAIVTIGAPTYTIGTAPVKLLSSVSISDLDSDRMSKATVTITTFGQAGDLLAYIAPPGNPVSASWDGAIRTLTLFGSATTEQYEEALQAVTFSATGGALLVRGISVRIIDDTGVESLLPGAATAGVRYSLPPSVITLGTPTHTIGTVPVKLLSSVTITDADSDGFSSARVSIEAFGQAGDVLGYVRPIGSPITASWDAGTKTLTLVGAGTKAEYEEALKAVTFSATGGVLLVRGIAISVSDDTGVSSSGLLNGAATANVRNPLPPLVVTAGWPSHTRNGAATTALGSASITDADSDYMTGATVRVTNGAGGDLLSFSPIVGIPLTANYSAATYTLTFTGNATRAQYVAALEAVKFSATSNGFGAVRNLTWTVTDDAGQTGSGASLLSVLW